MDISAYTKPLLRWWRLIAIVTVLAIVASTISMFFQAEQYVSKTTLMIGSTITQANPDSGQIYISQQLAQIYADMAMREPIQNATKDALQIDWLPQYQARVVPNAQLVEISVTDTNPARAQIIANELARQLILQNPAISGASETGNRQEFIRQQLSSLEQQIQDTQKQVETLQTSLIGLNSASQIQKIEGQISDLNDKLSTLRDSYASLLANSQQGALNILSVVEPANLPTNSVSTNKILIILVAALVGFTLGCGAAYLLEFLDRTVKTTSDVERIFKLPVIGYISEIEDKDQALAVSRDPNSVVAENFRLLRSNIEFFKISNPLKTILVTSPSQGNGKTTVAVNLTTSISQSEQDVVLVDADLRRPAVHAALKMSKEPGLVDIIKNKAEILSVVRQPQQAEINVIAAGNIPPNVTEVVGSKRISSILSRLKDTYEMIIVDAPPLIISDSYNLASKVDGVILVIVPGETTFDQAKAIKEQLDRADARMLGVVFNKLSARMGHSFGDNQYQALYSPRYYGDYVSGQPAREERNTGSRSKKIMAFFEHGEVPEEMAEDVQKAITVIKTQPRELVNKIRKTRVKARKNGAS